MRLPINLLLYTVSAGLLGLSGMNFWRSMQLNSQEVRGKAADQGTKEARDLTTRVVGGQVTTSWKYDRDPWRERWLGPNLTGKEPPKPVSGAAVEETVPTVAPQQPLDEVIELVSLVCDTSTKGEGGESHVIVRYRPGVDVRPPTWYQLENQAAAAPVQPMPMAGADAVGTRGRPQRPQGRPQAPAPTPMPGSTAGLEILQRVWAAGDGAPRFEATLWAPFETVRLVRVLPHGRSAIFRRPGPPGPDGAPTAAVEEEIIASQVDLAPDVKRTLLAMQLADSDGRVRPFAEPAVGLAAQAGGAWQDHQETTIVGNTVHISRRDQEVMQSDPEQILGRVTGESYRSRTGDTTGVRVLNIAPEVAQRFGVAQGDVLVSLNGEKVSTQAQALTVGRRLYNRGVRSFRAEFLTADGRKVERVFQAPDR